MITTKNGSTNGQAGLHKASKKATPSAKLFGPNNQPLNLQNVGSGKEQPFEDSYFDAVGNWLGRHGPAIAHLLLIVGSAASTVTNAWHWSHIDDELVISILITLLFCGLIVEAAFGYSWKMRGTTNLTGMQVHTALFMYNLASIIMIGDLGFSVIESALDIDDVAGYWVGIVQPLGSVWLVRKFYEIKGQHPMTIAKQKVATLKARAAASRVEHHAAEFRLELDEAKHERFMKRAALEQRIGAGEALVGSGWFRRQVNKAVKQSVNATLLPSIKEKVGKLPQLLGLKKSQKN